LACGGRHARRVRVDVLLHRAAGAVQPRAGRRWIGNLTALAPYQPIFVAFTLGFLGAGFWLVYLRPKPACTGGEACARPLPGRIVKTSLWLAIILVAAALAFPYVAPALLGT
jgi:mercuric ion transport protein